MKNRELIVKLIEDTCRLSFRPLEEDKGYHDRELADGYWTISGVISPLKGTFEEDDFREINLITLSFLSPIDDVITFRRFARSYYGGYDTQVFRISDDDFSNLIYHYREMIKQIQEPAYIYGRVLEKNPVWRDIPDERKEKFLRKVFEYCNKPLPEKDILNIIAEGRGICEHLERCREAGLIYHLDGDSFFWDFVNSHSKEISEFLGFEVTPQMFRNLYNGTSISWDFPLMESWENQLSTNDIREMVKQLEEQLKENREVVLLKVVNFPTAHGSRDGWLVMERESAEDLFERWRGSVNLDLENNLKLLAERLDYPVDTLTTVSPNGYWTAEREKDGRTETLHIFLARHPIDGMKFLTVEEIDAKEPEIQQENYKRFQLAYQNVKCVVPEARPYLEEKVRKYERLTKPAKQPIRDTVPEREMERRRGR